MKFDVLYIDPPWKFETWSEKGKGRSPENHYPTMTIGEICDLPVGDLAADNAALFLWVTWPIVFEAPKIFEAWGFRYSSRAFTWVKTTPRAFDRLRDMLEFEVEDEEIVRFLLGSFWHMGTGYTTRANDEICLLAIRGSMKAADRGVRSLVVSPVERHSKKPEEVYRRIERLYPDRRYLEIFARERRENWSSIGNEVDGLDVRISIPALVNVSAAESVDYESLSV